jgi:hypothetical protein
MPARLPLRQRWMLSSFCVFKRLTIEIELEEGRKMRLTNKVAGSRPEKTNGFFGKIHLEGMQDMSTIRDCDSIVAVR